MRRIVVCAASLSLALPAVAAPAYVGSAACKTCHASIYDRWQRTPMANVVRDPREHPDAILPDLTKPYPLLTFKKDDIWSTAVSDTAQTSSFLNVRRGSGLVRSGRMASGCSRG